MHLWKLPPIFYFDQKWKNGGAWVAMSRIQARGEAVRAEMLAIWSLLFSWGPEGRLSFREIGGVRPLLGG